MCLTLTLSLTLCLSLWLCPVCPEFVRVICILVMFAVYLPVILSCDYFCSDYILWMKFGIESDQNGCPDLDFRFHGVLFRESRCLSYQLWMRLSPFSFLHWWDVLTFMTIFGCVRVQGCYDLWMCAGRWRYVLPLATMILSRLYWMCHLPPLLSLYC